MSLTWIRPVLVRGGLIALLLGLSGCYQMHSDDDLRGVPVTNNPNIVPNTGSGLGKFTAMNP